MTFEQAALYQISRWEFWQWVITTLVTIGSIFGAAYWAQGIFNSNARKRENRERRLNGIQEMISLNHDMSLCFLDIYRLAEEDVDKKENRLIAFANRLFVLNSTLEFNVTNEINLLDKVLKKVTDEICDFYELKQQSKLYTTSSEVLEEYLKVSKDLANQLSVKFKEIEKEH